MKLIFKGQTGWKLIIEQGDKDLEVPVAVRPTSEAVMYVFGETTTDWVR